VVDQSYEFLDELARQPPLRDAGSLPESLDADDRIEPSLLSAPPLDLVCAQPDASAVVARHVWLVHPWNLGELPAHLPADTVVVGLFLNEFHQAWPWSERRWRFVASRMTELAHELWSGDVATVRAALQGAAKVQTLDELHLQPWLSGLAHCETAPALFPDVEKRCDSFSKWWTQVSRR
jgi:deoxyribodipyrimidine photo-lyase